MAVTSISKIQVRRGRKENLPQLSPGELGWSVDTRQLFIGNGTFADGSPQEGNTEILTQFSNASTSLLKTSIILPDDHTDVILQVGVSNFPTGVIRYSLTRGTGINAPPARVGKIWYAYTGSSTVAFDATQFIGDSLGVTFTITAVGTAIEFGYTTTNINQDATLTYNLLLF